MVKHLEKVTVNDFKNAENTDFSNEQEVAKLKEEIEKLRESGLGKEYPIVINGEEVYTDEKITSINPGKKYETVGYVSKASKEDAEKALQSATEVFKTWSKVLPEERADYLFRAADLMEERRHEFSAMLILESGKNYLEADAEVSEAIDFMNYYGTALLHINSSDHYLNPMPGEDNKMKYVPLGVGFIVPPWNFPLAITIGLTTSAVVAGNAVIMKPASATPIIAYKFFELIHEAGLPKGVINFLTGDSKEFGDYITGHKLTRFVSFTGSKDVGLHINELAGKQAEGQIWIKRVNAEMGGKDGIVVDETADLDKAAESIVQSGFSFQGQKCSAGSRVIAVESIYEELLEKVKQEADKLTLGNGEGNNDVGPVIHETAYNDILNYIEIGKQEAKLEYGGDKGSQEGYYINPTIFGEASPDARIMQEEIFGPVIAFSRAKDWEEAIDTYNNTDYGLTGGFFSSEQDRIDEAVERMYCGNLYLNRDITGALVGMHPFGGFNLSGTDSKVGSYDYLKLFSQAKTYTQAKD